MKGKQSLSVGCISEGHDAFMKGKEKSWNF